MLRFRKTWLAIGVGFVILVIYLSLTRHPIDWGRWLGFKVGHVLAYFWLMFWFAQIYKSTPARLGIAVSLCTLGIALEYAQMATSYRTFGYSDMRDNAIGVAGGLLLGLTSMSSVLESVDSALARMKQAP